MRVTHFEFSGNRALAVETLQAAVAPWIGRALNFGELMQVVEAIEVQYKQAGYFLAQAYLPPQKIRDGVIEIAISEGRLGEARLEGESRVAPGVMFGYLDRLPKDKALTLALLERQVLLVNDLSGGSASLDLQAGEAAGSTDVVLTQQPKELVSGRLEANNYGLPSTGERRYGVSLYANSPFNRGEQLSFNALVSDNRGLASYNLHGELPLGGDGWRLLATGSRAEYSLGGGYANLQASGKADSLRAGVSYPFIRSRLSNLKLLIEADHNKLLDQYLSTNTVLDKQTRGLTATLSGDWSDNFWRGGTTRAEIALRSGQLSLGPDAAEQDAPPLGPGSATSFSKLMFRVQRQQTLSRDVGLQLTLTGQWSRDNLDPSEKLSLGGPASMPGYLSGEASGDSGAHAKLGVRWQAHPGVTLSAFADYASLQLASNPLPTATTNSRRLADAGFAVEWLLGKNFTLSSMLAWADKETLSATDNDRPQFWFSLEYAW